MTCKGCGGPLRSNSVTGFCRKNKECDNAGTRGRHGLINAAYGSYVYFMFNALGELIYIGESRIAWGSRRNAHAKEEWYPEVAKVRGAPAPVNRYARLALESRLIHKYDHPRYNKKCLFPGCKHYPPRKGRKGTRVHPPMEMLGSVEELCMLVSARRREARP